MSYEFLKDLPSEPGLNDFLMVMAKAKGSDLFVTVGAPVVMKANGKMTPLTKEGMKPNAVRDLVYKAMTPKQQQEFEATHECNFAIGLSNAGRFRISAFYQRNQVGMVARRIETKIPSLQELEMPPIVRDLAMSKRGIIIMVGATGTGKSTTLAAMIGHRNQHSSGHIITIEDPIEFVHPHMGCVVTQREVGVDTDSWEAALKNTLRQAPDVIMIGEVRTRESMDHAISFAETGHLVLCTMHANNANQALERILNFFPDERKKQLLMDLSLNLRGVIAQQLVPKMPPHQGRKAILEIMIGTPFVNSLIKEGRVDEIKEAMKQGNESGMNTFDQSLVKAALLGEISQDEALRHADSQNDVRLAIKLSSGRALDSSNIRGIELQE